MQLDAPQTSGSQRTQSSDRIPCVGGEAFRASRCNTQATAITPSITDEVSNHCTDDGLALYDFRSGNVGDSRGIAGAGDVECELQREIEACVRCRLGNRLEL